MAENFGKRAVVVIAVVAAAGGAAAAGVAMAAGGGRDAASSGGAGAVSTAPVVRTTLTKSVQEGGSIGYGGSYTVAAPSGYSATQISAAQQAVAKDEQALAADERAESDASAAGGQSVTADRSNVSTARSALSTDQAAAKKACAGNGAASQACSTDTGKVTQDQTQLTQAEQQLGSAETTAKTSDDQARGKVGSDQTALRGDETTLASEQASAVNPGTAYTWLPSPGQAIKQDQPVYSVSDEPVPLLYGAIAAYRAFYTGMSDGGDVGELTHDLIALGYGDGLTQSDRYSSATAAAVARWQRARGLPGTGEILLGEVVFEPGPIRVTSVTPTAGAAVGGSGGSGGSGGTVLTATGTTPVVTVDLDVTQEYLVKPGDAVSVVLPDGTTTVGGHVETVGAVATCPSGSGTGAGSGSSTGSSSAGGSPCSSAGSGSNSTATVPVTVTLDRTPPGAGLDQAPVNVNITEARVSNVLAVPVNALLALAGGGYGVDVVTGSGTPRLVGVTTGLYGSTMVQISGAGITAGMRVAVPSS
jgi:Putative peptidoglycan binding domain